MYEKGNCCLILALQPIGKEDQVYIVANTHLNFNSNRGDIKLAEIKTLTDAIHHIKGYYSNFGEQKGQKKFGVIICGDFNSTPRSGVYEFMRSGSFDCLKLDK